MYLKRTIIQRTTSGPLSMKNVVTVGITEFAQGNLGEVVYVELPEEGQKVTQNEPFGVVESVKAVSDLVAPVSGTVIEVNSGIMDEPRCS